MSNNKIPICPLISAGNAVKVVCAQENCAWYMKNYKTCSVYLIAHNAVLDIKEKQAQKTLKSELHLQNWTKKKEAVHETGNK